MVRLFERAGMFARSALAESTTKAYTTDWHHFSDWCDERGLESLPADPATVMLYVADLADTYKPSTITRRLSSISVVHGTYGHPSPTRDPHVRRVTRGVRRQLGVALDEARPVMIGDLRKMVSHLPGTTIGTRDRALLLTGFAGAFRRSELVGLNVDDVEPREEGLLVHLRRSKTDQEGEGREVALPFGRDPHTCPVTAIHEWTSAASIDSGPLFRAVDRHGNVADDRLSAQSVSLIVKRAAERAEIQVTGLSGHSLRAGFATTAAANGVSEASIARQTGHTDMATLRRYVRHGSVFADNAATKVGL